MNAHYTYMLCKIMNKSYNNKREVFYFENKTCHTQVNNNNKAKFSLMLIMQFYT